MEEENEKKGTKLKNGLPTYNENGDIVWEGYINPALIPEKIVLPNGNTIPTKHFLQEYVEPRIPESGTFKLKNGNKLSAKQFIEEFILQEGQTKYNNDIEALFKDVLFDEKEEDEKEEDEKEDDEKVDDEKEEDEKVDDEKEEDEKVNKVSMDNIRETRKNEELTMIEVKPTSKKLLDRIKSFLLSFVNKNPKKEEQNNENKNKQDR